MKLVYGLAFTVVLPVLLLTWAGATTDVILLPGLTSFPGGAAMVLVGVLLMCMGMMELMIHGKGLPMNAFPPPQYVHRGVFRILPHPIYTGFVLTAFGVAVLSGSASGLWLVAPVSTLACVALVMGYEREDLRRCFGDQIAPCLLQLPPERDDRPGFFERLSVYILVFIPWLILYEAFVHIGPPPDAVSAYLPFEEHIPVIEWTELFYGGSYLLVLLVPLVAPTSRVLRRFAVSGNLTTIVISLVFISVPLVAPPRPFIPQGWLGEWLMLERQYDSAAAAFPSFHVVWSVLSALALSKSFPKHSWWWWSLSTAISVSCITTGMHALVDVGAGFGAGLLFWNYDRLWNVLRNASEQMANSWKEWRLGRIRIIIHGAYSGLGAAVGLQLVGSLAGFDYVGHALFMAFCSLVGAGLWAQFVEGSPSLLRPFGYYGGVLGIILSSLVLSLLDRDVWPVLGAYAVAAPIIQALGRLRCLVQGCCHGRETSPNIGIRYTHPNSRVCRLANMTGVPVHATPLYSILWNVAVGIILARLWSLDMTVSLIVGLYLILSGLGRFVEEAYRGEPQTPMFGRLTLYQMMAIISVLAGAVVTTVPTSTTPLGMTFDIRMTGAALAFGALTWVAQGVDFPESTRRFSRLTQ